MSKATSRQLRTWLPGGIGVAALAACFVLSGPATAIATGTPAPTAAGTCTIAPRQIPATGGAAPTVIVTAVPPLPTPFTPPAGSPAASDAATAITATIGEAIACANAGDVGRSLALLSDRAFAAYLSGPKGLDRGLLRLTAGTPTPAAPADQLTLVSISAITSLPEGRVGATVVTRNQIATYSDYVIFTLEHGRWVIDDSIPLATTANGTPGTTP